jgi:hypothetical protein
MTPRVARHAELINYRLLRQLCQNYYSYLTEPNFKLYPYLCRLDSPPHQQRVI